MSSGLATSFRQTDHPQDRLTSYMPRTLPLTLAILWAKLVTLVLSFWRISSFLIQSRRATTSFYLRGWGPESSRVVPAQQKKQNGRLFTRLTDDLVTIARIKLIRSAQDRSRCGNLWWRSMTSSGRTSINSNDDDDEFHVID